MSYISRAATLYYAHIFAVGQPTNLVLVAASWCMLPYVILPRLAACTLVSPDNISSNHFPKGYPRNSCPCNTVKHKNDPTVVYHALHFFWQMHLHMISEQNMLICLF